MQGRLTQRRRQLFARDAVQQVLVAGTQMLSRAHGMADGQLQVGQVVLRDDERRHRRIGITPALEQHLSQGERLQVLLTRLDPEAFGEVAVTGLDESFPLLHDLPPRQTPMPSWA